MGEELITSARLENVAVFEEISCLTGGSYCDRRAVMPGYCAKTST